MSELPTLRLRGADGEHEVTPENGVLYRHLGAKAIYDHILMVTDDEGDSREGYPIFVRGFLTDGDIDQATHFMVTRGFETHLNLKKAYESVMGAYDKVVEKQAEVGDFIPDEWVSDDRTD